MSAYISIGIKCEKTMEATKSVYLCVMRACTNRLCTAN